MAFCDSEFEDHSLVYRQWNVPATEVCGPNTTGT